MALGGLSGLASGVDTAAIVDQLMASSGRRTRASAAARSAVAGAPDGAQGHRDQARRAEDRRAGPRVRRHLGAESRRSSPPTPRASPSPAPAAPDRRLLAIEVDRLASSAPARYEWTPSASARTLTHARRRRQRRRSRSRSRHRRRDAKSPPSVNAINAPPRPARLSPPSSSGDKLVLSRARPARQRLQRRPAPASRAPRARTVRRPRRARRSSRRRLRDRPVRATNIVDDAIPGVKLTLKGVTAAPASVTVGAPAVDREEVKTKVKAFVDAYNARRHRHAREGAAEKRRRTPADAPTLPRARSSATPGC